MRTSCQMPFQTQRSPFPGLGLAPPMAPIMVEAEEKMSNKLAQSSEMKDLST
jgi:hypothetical protein